MQLALDPYMFRTVPLTELPGVVADLGYPAIELSPRDDFLPFFLHPRAAMNSEFNGRPEQAGGSERRFWRSLEELLPVFEREGVELPHPDDFVEDGRAAVDLVREQIETYTKGW